jgi:hypothetical protein
MKAKAFLICVALSVVFIIAEPCYTQKVAVTGDSSQDVLKIPIEEVRIPLFAFDERGRFDAQLSAGDLLIREDGIAQNVRGVYRVPAYVLLLVDTGGEVNLLKTARLTADVAVEFISKLRPEDPVRVPQAGRDFPSSGIARSIQTRLFRDCCQAVTGIHHAQPDCIYVSSDLTLNSPDLTLNLIHTY